MVGNEIRRREFQEQVMRLVFLLAASASIVAVALICVFMFGNGIPAMAEIGFKEFLSTLRIPI